MKRYYKTTPQQRARQAVHDAVASGRLIKPETCQRCGKSTDISSHHHHGYAKMFYLDVEWLCKDCHRLRDVDAAEEERLARIRLLGDGSTTTLEWI